jgi:hypothetical protein
MKAASLYVLTALVTGLHNFYWLMSVVNGAPINPLNCIALLGSATLLGAAILLPFRPRVAAKAGLAGSLLLWVFYAPLIAVSFIQPFSTWLQVRTFISFRDYVPLVGLIVGPILLIACTSHSTLFFRRNQEFGKAL